ncbi:membrane protein [Uliginosibacterium flavum]|uniref:Transmembrane protein n=1 Tax=Uliginosibacterium flavum TaxID=1396831 RepID=A0ABV2TLD7_9RHOO
MAVTLTNRLILILWPSFLLAGVAEIIFFTLVNPQELYLLGQPVHYSSTTTYSVGFLMFWALCATTSAATLFFARTSENINLPGDSGL